MNALLSAQFTDLPRVIINGSVPLLFPYTVLNKNCNAAAEEIKIAMVQGNVSIGISNPEYKLDVTAAEAE